MKQALRQKIFTLRDAHEPAVKLEREDAIDEKITSLPEFQNAHTILLYSAVRGEVSLQNIKEKFISDKKLVLPKVIKDTKELKLYEIPNLEYLESGYAGILEPPEHLPEIQPDEIDLAIIPGVAFDLKGNRLGFGQGFYDRLLKKIDCRTIAPAFEFQVTDELPAEDHDMPVDIVVTEERTIR